MQDTKRDRFRNELLAQAHGVRAPQERSREAMRALIAECAERHHESLALLAISEQEDARAEAKRRKGIPLCTGVLDYFPAALAEVARLSKAGNDVHNPGEPLHHARGKSTDHADCLLRHLATRGELDPETGITHTASVAWRALAMLQEELEAAGAPKARGAR